MSLKIALLTLLLMLFCLPVQAQDTVLIGSEKALIAFSQSVRRGELCDARVLITQDIALSQPLEPIGSVRYPFAGTFDGQGHVISKGILSGAGPQGLFGLIAPEGKVCNLTLDSFVVSGSECAGVLAGRCAGTLEDCAVSNSFVSVFSRAAYDPAAGGLCGSLSGTARRCAVVQTEIAAPTCAGGLCGQLVSGVLDGCLFSGSVNCPSVFDAPSGGLAGAVGGDALMRFCLGYGSVSSPESGYTGGVAGGVFGGQINGCAFSGEITSPARHSGGIAGEAADHAQLAACRRDPSPLPAVGYGQADSAPLPNGPLSLNDMVHRLLSFSFSFLN